MRKAITLVGNSNALILDRTVCEVVGIGVGSIVDVTIEGRKVIIEPTGQMKVAPPRRRDSRGPRMHSRRTFKSVADVRKPVWSPLRDESGEIPLHILAREHVPAIQELGRWGFDSERMAALESLPTMHPAAAIRRICGLRIVEGSTRDVTVARRVRFVFEELEDLDDWDRVIALAVARYPLESNDNMSAGSGASAVTLLPSG